MNYYLIANPHARNGLGRKKLAELDRQFRQRGLRHELALCHGFDHARELALQANRAGHDVIVAVGGDGTINRVLNGFFDADGRRLSGARLGVVHIGTSPDFCRSYGVPTELGAAVDVLGAGVTRPIAVGRVIYEPDPERGPERGPVHPPQYCYGGRVLRSTAEGGHSCPPGESYPAPETSHGARELARGWTPNERAPNSAVFGCCANIGLGAELARLANGGIRKYAGDFLGTLLSLLRLLLRYRPRTLQMTLDGQPRRLTRVYNIAVGKTAYIASGIKVRHSLGEQDRRFYVLCVRNVAWNNVGRILRALYSGRPIASDACLSLEYARYVRVAPVEGTAEVEFDGDPAGQCPCCIQTAPDLLDLLVPGHGSRKALTRQASERGLGILPKPPRAGCPCHELDLSAPRFEIQGL